MAVAPALPWRAASGEVLRRRLGVPAWVGASTMALAAGLGARGVAQLAVFGLGSFALAGVARSFAVGVTARRRATGEVWPAALRAAVAGNRRLYGGLVVHAGVVLVAVALAASSGYAVKREVRLAQGQEAMVAGHRLTFLGTTQRQTGQKRTLWARVRVERGDRQLGVYEPALSLYPNRVEAIGTPSVHTGALRDVYLTLVSSPDEAGKVTVGVLVNPLVVWLWIGGGVMAVGTAVAAWPGRRRTRLPAGRAMPEPARQEVRV
jgi:cytochrome c-type biogenesis protein CcmF